MQNPAQEFNKIGEKHYKNKDYDKALTGFLNGLHLDPNNIHSMNNIGVVYAKKGDYELAEEYFRMAITRDPTYAEGFNNLGNVLRLMGFQKTAERHLDTAVRIRPNYEGALLNLALVAEDMGNLKKAEECNFRAYAISKSPEYLAHIYYLKRKMCQWNDLGSLAHKLDGYLDKKGESPFINIIRTTNERVNLQVAKAWTNETSRIRNKFQISNHKPQKKLKIKNFDFKIIKVGYLSETFRDHPVGNCIADIFKYHSKRKFETFVYSYGINDGSLIRRSVQKHANNFFDIRKTNTKDCVQLIKSHALDILIDLQGLTKDNRMEILSYRPAPIQIGYLGFPGTSGSKFIDYIIADKIALPAKSQKYYTEKIIYLDRPYQINSTLLADNKLTKRQDHSLPMDKLVFCSFNRSVKIEQKMFNTWLAILKKVPNSVLWLYLDNAYAHTNLLSYAISKGIDGSRLIFANHLTIGKHLDRLKLADIALDTSIYSGGATTANALLVGLPVVTLRGKHYLSRMSESILAGIKLDELVAKNSREYVNMAVKLATDPKYFQKIRTKIRKYKKLIFDPKGFTKDFEKLLANITHDRLTPG